MFRRILYPRSSGGWDPLLVWICLVVVICVWVKIFRVWVGGDTRWLEEEQGIHDFLSKVGNILSSKKSQKMGSRN